MKIMSFFRASRFERAVCPEKSHPITYIFVQKKETL